MDRATYDATNDRMQAQEQSVFKISLSAVQDEGVWYMEIRTSEGAYTREKVQNANTPNTEDAAYDLIQQTKRYFQHLIVSRN